MGGHNDQQRSITHKVIVMIHNDKNKIQLLKFEFLLTIVEFIYKHYNFSDHICSFGGFFFFFFLFSSSFYTVHVPMVYQIFGPSRICNSKPNLINDFLVEIIKKHEGTD